MIQERCWFFQIDFFVEYFPHRIKIFSFQPVLCHPHTQIRIILFHDVQRDIPNLEFSPGHVSIRLVHLKLDPEGENDADIGRDNEVVDNGCDNEV